jgi:hypothetical protein
MNDDQFDDDEFDHEQLLEQLVTGVLRQADLADLCEDADLPVVLAGLSWPHDSTTLGPHAHDSSNCWLLADVGATRRRSGPTAARDSVVV